MDKEREVIQNTPVVVLAGGLGTRLASITGAETPKALVEIDGGVTIIDHLLDGLTAQGFRQFIFCLGFLHTKVREYLETRSNKDDSTYVYSVETTPLGTAGAIELAIAEHGLNKPFLLVTSDAIFPYQQIKELALNHKDDTISWAVTSVYHEVAAEHVSHLVDTRSETLVGNTLSSWHIQERIKDLYEAGNIAVYNDAGHGIIDPSIFTSAMRTFRRLCGNRDRVCWYKDILPMLAEKNRRNIQRKNEPLVQVFDEKAPYIDIGTPDRLEFAREWIKVID